MKLSDKLQILISKDIYPFHMPGHKRRPVSSFDPYEIDITEIEGFDDLHFPEGVLRELEQRWARLYKADECILSVNGSTACNMSAFFAAVAGGEHVMVAANCHKSVFNAASLRRCYVEMVYPGLSEDGIFRGLTVEEVSSALDKVEVKPSALFLTHPTYEGMLSELKEICKFCHERGIAVIVDAAHGAHFGLDETQPESPISMGADAVVMSLHKTLPAFTQSACIVFPEKGLINPGDVRRYMHCFESSSPSYILLSGMERCIDELERIGHEGWEAYAHRLDGFYEKIGSLDHIRLADRVGRDPGKLFFSAEGMTGKGLADRLRDEYKIETEMSEGPFVLAMTSAADTDEGFERLTRALTEINDSIDTIDNSELSNDLDKTILRDIYNRSPERKMTMFEAFESRREDVILDSCRGRTASDMICLYPPGIPFITPGEVITDQDIGMIYEGRKKGYNITGINEDKISCVLE